MEGDFHFIESFLYYCSPVIHMEIHTLSVTFIMHYPLLCCQRVCVCVTCVYGNGKLGYCCPHDNFLIIP